MHFSPSPRRNMVQRATKNTNGGKFLIVYIKAKIQYFKNHDFISKYTRPRQQRHIKLVGAPYIKLGRDIRLKKGFYDYNINLVL